MSAPAQALVRTPAAAPARARRLDIGFLAGVVVSALAAIAAIASTGVGPGYFLHASGALIVVGGTMGVALLTTSLPGLFRTMRRVASLVSAETVDREALIEQIVSLAREARRSILPKMEAEIRRAGSAFLRDALILAMDVKDRAELQASLETEIRNYGRQGEADARVLEVAGGFAPTLGILGTVIGLVDVLRQFSTADSAGLGIGMAFVSTLYGLGLANLLLLPAAHRIRARVVEEFETCEMTAEGVLCIYDQVHPYVIRQRLRSFVRP